MGTWTKRSLAVYSILLPVTIVITVAVAFLLVNDRDANFHVGLWILVTAELINFFYVIYVSVGKAAQRSLPFYISPGMLICVVYLLGTLLLFFVALTPIGMKYLIVLEILWFFLFVVAMCVASLAFGFFASMDEKRDRERAPIIDLRNRVAAIVDKAGLIDGDGIKPVLEILKDLQEDVKYATSESIPGSKDVDRDISTALRELDEKLDDAEKGKLEGEDFEKLIKEVTSIRNTVKRREELIKQLRSSG